MKTPTIKTKITIEGDMIDAYAELILGLFLMTGILKNQRMSKYEKADKSHALIIRAETRKPPLGSLGLSDIPEEYPRMTVTVTQKGMGHYYIFNDADGNEVFSLEAPQFAVLREVMALPSHVKAAVLKAAEIMGDK